MPKLSEVLNKLEGFVITTSKKAAGLMSETLTAIEPELEKDITTILKNGIPIAWMALSTGGVSACVAASIEYITIQLPHLGEEIWTALGAELALKAKNVTPVSAVPAPTVITPIPSEISPIIPGN